MKAKGDRMMARKSTKAEQEQKKVDFPKPQRVGRIEAKLQADKEAAAKEKKQPPVVVQIAKAKETKNAQMSVKLYQDTYDKFCKINRERGMSNNSVVNMLIAQYVKDNKDLLDD